MYVYVWILSKLVMMDAFINRYTLTCRHAEKLRLAGTAYFNWHLVCTLAQCTHCYIHVHVYKLVINDTASPARQGQHSTPLHRYNSHSESLIPSNAVPAVTTGWHSKIDVANILKLHFRRVVVMRWCMVFVLEIDFCSNHGVKKKTLHMHVYKSYQHLQ